MRMRLMWIFAAGWTVAAPLSASITMSIDVLDGNDPGAPAPVGLVVVDVGVDLSADDWLVSAGVIGRTFNGATLIYGENPDPNFPGPTFRPPGLDNRFVSFGSDESQPLGRCGDGEANPGIQVAKWNGGTGFPRGAAGSVVIRLARADVQSVARSAWMSVHGPEPRDGCSFWRPRLD